MADLDPASLPSVEQAKAMQRERQPERAAEIIDQKAGQAMQAAYAGVRHRYDDLRTTEHDVSRSQAAGGRYDDLRAAEPPPEIVRDFQAAAARATEPAAPIWDREAEARAADERIIDAAIRTAPEARQRQEPGAGPEPHGATAEAAQAPPQAAERGGTYEPDAVREVAAAADATVDRAAHAGEGILRGLGKLFARFIGWLADSIAPPPPPTRDQAERMARSAEERQEAGAQQQAEARQQAEQEFLLCEIERSRQSTDHINNPTAAELYGTPKPWTQERDKERDRDRELEL
jgi:hypothetical protein